MMLLLLTIGMLQASAVDAALDGMQKRYAAASTVSADFTQTYRAPGIEQRESGVVWLRKPGLMRWEYREPANKLFVADGKQAYLYLPEDRQVQVRGLSSEDLRATPLRFLLGQGDIRGAYHAEEAGTLPSSTGAVVIRLVPRQGDSEYEHIVVEIDRRTFSLTRIEIRERSGGTSEFHFRNLVLNPRLEGRLFEFRIPRGVEVVRLDER